MNSVFGNMDETPVWMDMPSSRTVEKRGSKTALVKATGHEKNRFTVVLSCMADGTAFKTNSYFQAENRSENKFPAWYCCSRTVQGLDGRYENLGGIGLGMSSRRPTS